nr:Chain P, mupain-1-16 [synthetic construct]4X1R_P Chain P, mupain-1-12 [synthetic construct]6A8O_P Chain P, peptide inhibitor [Synthemiopsis]
CPAYSAYLDC